MTGAARNVKRGPDRSCIIRSCTSLRKNGGKRLRGRSGGYRKGGATTSTSVNGGKSRWGSLEGRVCPTTSSSCNASLAAIMRCGRSQNTNQRKKIGNSESKIDRVLSPKAYRSAVCGEKQKCQNNILNQRFFERKKKAGFTFFRGTRKNWHGEGASFSFKAWLGGKGDGGRAQRYPVFAA